MDIPENPFRKAMASFYIERHMGKPEDNVIRIAVNGESGESKSIDYYISAEKFLAESFSIIKELTPENECKTSKILIRYYMMQTYVSYEIERLIATKNMT